MKNAFKKVAVVIVALMLFLLCSCSNVSETQVSTTAASTRSSNFKAPDFPENMEHEPPQGMGFDISNEDIFEKGYYAVQYDSFEGAYLYWSTKNNSGSDIEWSVYLSDKELSLETLSGVLWAANGFNRPDKRTNATGLNKQTIVVYVCMKSGAYRYDAKANSLVKVCGEDLRLAIAAHQPFAAKAPVALLITADLSDPAYTGRRSTLTHYDAGIVSGNIYLYCAANSLATVCRGSMDRDALKKALKLPDSTILHLNHPVGYPAEKAK